MGVWRGGVGRVRERGVWRLWLGFLGWAVCFGFGFEVAGFLKV